MAMPLHLVREEPAPSAPGERRLAEELWRIAAQYGFNPAKGLIENQHAKAEFASRTGQFITKHKLVSKPNAPLPRRTFEHYLVRNKRENWDRKEQVILPRINELALVFGLVFLQYSYHKLPYLTGVDALKDEVVWLLRHFEYRLPPHCAIYNPALCDWQSLEVLWRAVRDYNAEEKLELPVPGLSGNLDACRSCSYAHLCRTV